MTTLELSAKSHSTSRWDRFASWSLAGPLGVVLGALAIAQLLTWAPQYLTWPWWSDHDAFATIDYGWHLGKLPYRDLVSNNFPGQIYVFYALGKLFGWGWTPGIYLFDAALVGLLGLALAVWSRRVWGSVLPGIVGWLSFAGYYFQLDYSQTAQRDWHGPLFGVLGLLLAQSSNSRGGRIGSAVLLAAGLVFRPQVIVLIPAYALAIVSSTELDDRRSGRRAIALLEWLFALGIALAVAFAPLFVAGVGRDFLLGLRHAGHGWRDGAILGVLKGFLVELAMIKVWIVAMAIVILSGRVEQHNLRVVSTVWLTALAGALLYRPLSPIAHSYLVHPVMLVWSILAAILTGLLLELKALAPSLRLIAVLLVLGLQANGRPLFCNPGWTPIALASLRAHQDPEPAPLGYRHNLNVIKTPPYDWTDYRDMLIYVRTKTNPATRVANVLKRMPAVTGPVARLPVFRAESLEWLLVNPDDERPFARDLEAATDSIVVWDPEAPNRDTFFKLELLEPVIRRCYELDARFGDIEVWKRKRDTERMGLNQR